MPSLPPFSALLTVLALSGLPSAAQTAAMPVQVASVDDTQAPKPAPAAEVPAEHLSQVRIVRLSEIRGEAQLDRDAGRGFEPAFANIPITRHSRLRTEAGLAEIEFEDNSTLRLTPDSQVDFTELGRSANGATVTHCTVVKGTVYVTLVRTANARFTLAAGNATLRLNPGSHLRLDLASPLSTLAVMDGAVDLTTASGSTTVPKKSMLTFGTSPEAAAPPQIVAVNKVAAAPYDSWDKQGNDYQKHYASNAFSGGTGALYGSSDLNYYGSFADLPGCGNVWRPYFASAAWDPYGAGTFALYPGAGYSFISPYPWGWMPFHSGAWQQCGSAGWGWSPNGQFSGLNNVAALNGAAAGSNRLTHAPLKPPTGTASLVSIGGQSAEQSKLTAPGTFTFRQNSAGLGVPRDVFGKLNGTAHTVERKGVAHADAEVGYMSVPSAGGGNRGFASLASSPASARSIAVISRPSASAGNASAFSALPAAGSSSSSRAGGSFSTASTPVASHGSVGAAGGGAHK